MEADKLMPLELDKRAYRFFPTSIHNTIDRKGGKNIIY
jgi:hypothetical protein